MINSWFHAHGQCKKMIKGINRVLFCSSHVSFAFYQETNCIFKSLFLNDAFFDLLMSSDIKLSPSEHVWFIPGATDCVLHATRNKPDFHVESLIFSFWQCAGFPSPHIITAPNMCWMLRRPCKFSSSWHAAPPAVQPPGVELHSAHSGEFSPHVALCLSCSFSSLIWHLFIFSPASVTCSIRLWYRTFLFDYFFFFTYFPQSIQNSGVCLTAALCLTASLGHSYSIKH